MTNGEIFCQILSEASGKPKGQVTELMAAFTKQFGAANFDEQVPDAEAQKTLCALRKELPGIRAWLEEGRVQSTQRIKHIAAQN